MPRTLLYVTTVTLAILAIAPAAAAKQARCFTTDDGNYPCTFTATDTDGSFEISAPGKVTLRLAMDTPGSAFGFIASQPGKFTALPGTFTRSAKDAACWDNSTTNTQICAW